jgi:hypothetical protein
MKIRATTIFFVLLGTTSSVGAVAAQERWEIGVAAGYGQYRNATLSNSTGEASGGFKPGPAFGVVAGNEIRSYLAGETRYTYRQNDLKLSRAGSDARFDGESHILNYDFLFHLYDRAARVRPFLAVGAGVKIFRGTGAERAFQPLTTFAVLSKDVEITPLVSVGGGVKVQINKFVILRVEGRDFATTFPRDVVAPVPGTRVSGWLHDFVPLVGISFVFGR